MGFKQNNKSKRDQEIAYKEWLQCNLSLFIESGIPSLAYKTHDDWAYLHFYDYHDRGNWTTPPSTDIHFTSDQLSKDQLKIFNQLKHKWDIACNNNSILGTRLSSKKSP